MSKTEWVQNPGDLWNPEFLLSPELRTQKQRKIIFWYRFPPLWDNTENCWIVQKPNPLKARFWERISVELSAVQRCPGQHYGCWQFSPGSPCSMELAFLCVKDIIMFFIYIFHFSKQHKRTNKRSCTFPNEISSQQLCCVIDDPFQVQMCLTPLAWKFPDIFYCIIFIMCKSSSHIFEL